VADASGRYTSSFFWGNNYWTGSESLCYQLDFSATQQDAPAFRLGFYTVRLQIDLPQDIAPNVSTNYTRVRILMLSLAQGVAYHLKCNPTTITYYGTKKKSEAGSLHVPHITDSPNFPCNI
jgi:hypothetical protein